MWIDIGRKYVFSKMVNIYGWFCLDFSFGLEMQFIDYLNL